jgi:hypothetical protein
VPGATLAAAVALGLASLALVAVRWRLRSLLALLCGALGIGSAVAAGTAGRAEGAATHYLAGSLAAALIGTVLLLLDRAVQRLLDREPDDVVGESDPSAE